MLNLGLVLPEFMFFSGEGEDDKGGGDGGGRASNCGRCSCDEGGVYPHPLLPEDYLNDRLLCLGFQIGPKHDER